MRYFSSYILKDEVHSHSHYYVIIILYYVELSTFTKANIFKYV